MLQYASITDVCAVHGILPGAGHGPFRLRILVPKITITPRLILGQNYQ